MTPLEALKPWIMLTLLLWSLFLLTLAAWRAPKATARAFDRLGVILFAVLFPVVLVPIGLFFGLLAYAQIFRKVYGTFIPTAWRGR